MSTAEDFDALGAGVEAELIEVAVDTSAPSTRRARAVTALGLFSPPGVRSALEGLLGDADVEGLQRRKAAYALGEGFGADALVSLGAALADPDPQLRMAAARVLTSLDLAPARDLLRARRDTESKAAVGESWMLAWRWPRDPAACTGGGRVGHSGAAAGLW